MTVSDAPVSDASPSRGTVHVTMLDPLGSGAPAGSGLTVMFFDPDGSVVKKATTDANGKADADVLPGGTVVGIGLNTLDTTYYNLWTVLDVRPGDDLTLGSRFLNTASFEWFTVKFPPLAGADGYWVSSPCGAQSVLPSADPFVQFTLTDACKPATMELVITAYAKGQAIASIDDPGVPITVDGIYPETHAWGGVHSLTATFTNVDPVITSLGMARLVPDGVGISDSASAAIAATTAVTVTGGASATAQILTTAQTATSVQRVRELVAGSAASYRLDVGANLLPWFGAPSYDFDSRKITVPVDTTGVTNHDAPDLFALAFSYLRTGADHRSTLFAWTIYAPTIRDVTLPLLPGNTAQPTDLAWLLPVPTDTSRSIAAMAFDASKVTGYDSLRNNPGDAIVRYAHALPADPKVRVSVYGFDVNL